MESAHEALDKKKKTNRSLHGSEGGQKAVQGGKEEIEDIK